MNLPLVAAISFFAFGGLFVGTVLLLLFNPRSREVRWWAVFQAANLVWLGTQGWGAVAGGMAQLGPVLNLAVQLMPALFLSFVLSSDARRPAWAPFAPVALGIAFVAVERALVPPGPSLVVAVWQVVMWGAGTLLLLQTNWKNESWKHSRDRRLGRAIFAMLVVIAPLALIGGMTIGARMWVYAMPLVVVWIQLILFVGVARLRFYDIEIRAARTGDLAAEAAEQERLAVLGELSASLAHEIRNPLTGVRSLTQRLAEEEIEPARRVRYAGVILEEVGRLERLVANLLDVARRAPRAGDAPANTALAPLFDDLALLLRARAERAGVRLVVDADAAWAGAPREPLAQALLNLLLNALRHTPPRGAVRLSARDRGDGVELCVRDEGPGVPAGERERIFEPFHSTAGGTGLGLAVVRRLAREHGWAIAVADAPGGGAEFRLVVQPPPAAAGATAPIAAVTPAA